MAICKVSGRVERKWFMEVMERSLVVLPHFHVLLQISCFPVTPTHADGEREGPRNLNYGPNKL